MLNFLPNSRVARYLAVCLIYWGALSLIGKAAEPFAYIVAWLSLLLMLPLGFLAPGANTGLSPFTIMGAISIALLATAAAFEAYGGGKWFARFGLIFALLAITVQFGPTGVGR